MYPDLKSFPGGRKGYLRYAHQNWGTPLARICLGYQLLGKPQTRCGAGSTPLAFSHRRTFLLNIFLLPNFLSHRKAYKLQPYFVNSSKKPEAKRVRREETKFPIPCSLQSI